MNPTQQEYATSALMNGLESGLSLLEISEAFSASDDAVDFDGRVCAMIREKEKAQ